MKISWKEFVFTIIGISMSATCVGVIAAQLVLLLEGQTITITPDVFNYIELPIAMITLAWLLRTIQRFRKEVRGGR